MFVPYGALTLGYMSIVSMKLLPIRLLSLGLLSCVYCQAPAFVRQILTEAHTV